LLLLMMVHGIHATRHGRWVGIVTVVVRRHGHRGASAARGCHWATWTSRVHFRLDGHGIVLCSRSGPIAAASHLGLEAQLFRVRLFVVLFRPAGVHVLVLQHLGRFNRQLGAHRWRAVVRRCRRQVFRWPASRTTAAVVAVVATHLLVRILIDVAHVLVLLLIESAVVAHWKSMGKKNGNDMLFSTIIRAEFCWE